MKWSRTVRYTDDNGQIHDAIFDLQQTEVSLIPIWSSLPEDMGLGLDIKNRRKAPLLTLVWEVRPMRVSMTIEDRSTAEIGASKMRWMTAGGVGTFSRTDGIGSRFLSR